MSIGAAPDSTSTTTAYTVTLSLTGDTTDLGNGTWRYNYAVMNFDFAREATQGAEPSLRVLRNYGFKRFSVPLLGGNVLSREFSDGDSNAANDWTAPLTPDPSAVEWVAPADSASLNWGTLFRFSFIANQAPGANAVTMHIAADNTREVVTAPNVLAPAATALKSAAAR